MRKTETFGFASVLLAMNVMGKRCQQSKEFVEETGSSLSADPPNEKNGIADDAQAAEKHGRDCDERIEKAAKPKKHQVPEAIFALATLVSDGLGS